MPSPSRAAIYARISEDSTGEASGVRRQVVACRDLAATRGWEVVEVCTDNDISALRGKYRPGYSRVLDLVRSGAVDYVLVWQTSRLLRNRRERADAIALFAEAKVGIIAVKGTDLDLSTAAGRGIAGLLGEFDTMESEVKSERVAAAAADRASRGAPNAGLGYGWIKDDSTYVENPEQGAIVREITRRLLAGESLLAVTSNLNQRRVPAPIGATWGKTSVKKIALRASNAGLRVHHRGRTTEQIFDGHWPSLVRRDDWERLTQILTAPARRTNGATRPGARKHLLTWGIGECGVCGAHLRVSLKGNATHGSKRHLYVCDARGCVGRDEARVDEYIAGVAIARLALPNALWLMLGDETAAKKAADRAGELRGRLEDAADRYADGRITGPQLERITARLVPQIAEAEAEQARGLVAVDLDTLTQLAGPKAQAKWDQMSVTQRRSVLTALRLRVRVMPVARRGPGFDAGSIEIEWVPT